MGAWVLSLGLIVGLAARAGELATLGAASFAMFILLGLIDLWFVPERRIGPVGVAVVTGVVVSTSLFLLLAQALQWESDTVLRVAGGIATGLSGAFIVHQATSPATP